MQHNQGGFESIDHGATTMSEHRHIDRKTEVLRQLPNEPSRRFYRDVTLYVMRYFQESIHVQLRITHIRRGQCLQSAETLLLSRSTCASNEKNVGSQFPGTVKAERLETQFKGAT
jgi:hypothetical protein